MFEFCVICLNIYTGVETHTRTHNWILFILKKKCSFHFPHRQSNNNHSITTTSKATRACNHCLCSIIMHIRFVILFVQYAINSDPLHKQGMVLIFMLNRMFTLIKNKKSKSNYFFSGLDAWRNVVQNISSHILLKCSC